MLDDINKPLQLEIDSQVVRQLGEELITDSAQALLELVKNSYDADAEWCNVKIDTKTKTTILQQTVQGLISVEDDGCGMDFDAIKRGWLTISLSPKRKFKAEKKVTPKFKRTPLGDKGLGRLGSMRLGDILRITTFINEQNEGLQITFNWEDCISGRALSDVPIHIDPIESRGKKGTKIEIFSLKDISYWESQKSIGQLGDDLSTMISPFGEIDHFAPALSVNGNDVCLDKVGEGFLNLAKSSFSMKWDDANLSMDGKIRLSLLKTDKNKDYYDRFVFPDNGRAFFEFAQKDKRCMQYNLVLNDSDGWFVSFSDSKNWSENIQKTDSLLSLLAKSPGAFTGAFFGFSLDERDTPNLGSISGNYKDRVKANAGVFVLRDGFRVRMSDDWLGFGKEQTSGRSYYGLRPGNLVGFIAISADKNSALVEKSDREGFTDNPEWQGFEMITTSFKDFANNTLEAIRRTLNDFLEDAKTHNADIATSVEEKISLAGETVKAVSAVAHRLESKRNGRQALQQKNKIIRAELSSRKDVSHELSKQLTESLDAIDAIIADADSVEEALVQLTKIQNTADIEVIQASQAQLKKQVSEVYDTVATGLAAEGLMHEITPLLREANSYLDAVKRKLKNESLKDSSVFLQIGLIKEINNTVQQRVGFINPMMRTLREVRSDISLLSFLKRYFENRNDTLSQKSIKWHIDISNEEDIVIHINQGRLIQVIDNLVRNSEYWLMRFGATEVDLKKEIHVECKNNFLVIWDTGKGIRTAIENSIFELFVTDKPSGEGHGLGLFIVSQLLDNVGCSITLGQKRNNNGNRYQFIIDFSPIIKGNDKK